MDLEIIARQQYFATMSGAMAPKANGDTQTEGIKPIFAEQKYAETMNAEYHAGLAILVTHVLMVDVKKFAQLLVAFVVQLSVVMLSAAIPR